MRSKKLVCGIDVSKNTLDAVYNEDGKIHHVKKKNNKEGHIELVEKLGLQRTYLMETTGLYGLEFACYLKSRRADIRIENAIKIKRFMQLNMQKNKSDKADALWIYKYAVERDTDRWAKPTRQYFYAKQIMSFLELSKKVSVMHQNYLKSLLLYPNISKTVLKIMNQLKEISNQNEEDLTAELDNLVEKMYPGLKDRLLTIPGLGIKTITRLLILTHGFKKIKSYKALISFVGFSPKETTSGTSLHKKTVISNSGDRTLRTNMYMSALSSIKSKGHFRDQYNRMKESNKNGKVIIIAIANKMLKIAYAVATQNTVYNPDYKSVLS